MAKHLKGKCIDGFELEIFALTFLKKFYKEKEIPLGIHKVFYPILENPKRLEYLVSLFMRMKSLRLALKNTIIN